MVFRISLFTVLYFNFVPLQIQGDKVSIGESWEKWVELEVLFSNTEYAAVFYQRKKMVTHGAIFAAYILNPKFKGIQLKLSYSMKFLIIKMIYF